MNGSTAADANPRSTREQNLDLSFPREKKKERGIDEGALAGVKEGRMLRPCEKQEGEEGSDSGYVYMGRPGTEKTTGES